MGDHHGAVPAGALDVAGAGWAAVELGALAVVLLVWALHGAGRRWVRGRAPWPAARTALFAGGLLCVAAALVGPLARAAHGSFTAHMGAHLLLGMLGPLLLALGAPVTLALRALPVRRARALTRLLRTPPVRVLAHPAVAALLAGGGAWVLYTTALFPAMHASPWVHAAVHAHVLASGYLLAASLVGVDPDPHRAPVAVRAGVLVVYVAAHALLAKHLYAVPPPGVDARDAEVGAQLMAHGGDVVDLALAVLVALGWYRATAPRGRAARRRRTVAGRVPTCPTAAPLRASTPPRAAGPGARPT
ncbi:cytochrome c oxidase assembly protein [Pseudokineococcus marinus]|uniref:Cytochrome c oxidase assembly protein n=1 Tax=Pseudokineococcus marinus TaxID=351215 RepID=A0A849BNL7_9ACTN|nr:cytochrome c oxidase assembly protein [Pseudokineococcus marinus]NNH23005.1 cytochrome c oxidase assembly protein [Pseudokineococcus marinus]